MKSVQYLPFPSKMTFVDLYIPFLCAVVRSPKSQHYFLCYKGEKVGQINYNFQNCGRIWASIQKSGENETPDYYYGYSHRYSMHEINRVNLQTFVSEPTPEITDFTLGAEGDARLLDFHWDWTDKQKTEAYRIFQDIFGGNWENLGKWIYTWNTPRTLRRQCGYTGRPSFRSSKVMKIKYEFPKEYDSEGEEYDCSDTQPNFENHKFVFLADGKLFDISKYSATRVYDVPADLKLEDVDLAGIPLMWWLLMVRPTEFVDTATTCMAFKKMIHELCESRFDSKYTARYMAKNLWLMEGDKIVKLDVYNTKVIKDRRVCRQLTLDEIRALHDRKEDFWVGVGVLKKLVSVKPRSESESESSTTP